ncbi:probable cytochrome P450 49a1 isoform X2 [Dendroctonus ponderosae]|uniref:Cytochrome P450 n=1 Tax=Dendroctonus ponderosae TaxID=77166 RepID=A0AAR5NZW2_DENPD|nr:probable cytochrome P450 49a1 isoform X2 [Dendroctonus ponderosae]
MAILKSFLELNRPFKVICKRCLNSSAQFTDVLTSETCEVGESAQIKKIKPYEDIPGPKPLPLLGNNWRFIPYIGDFQIEHIDKVSKKLYTKYGKLVKVGGLFGRPDMLFLFDPDEIEKVFRKEDALPLRPSMPSLNYYKHNLRKEFFGDLGGVISVHGQNWQKFRSKVNQIMLQPRSAKMYAQVILETAEKFVERIGGLRNDASEMPDNFLNEIHRWSLESLARIALDIKMGCLEEHPPADTQRLIDAINTFFINVPILELKIPFWRVFPTSTFNRYIEALDSIREICLKYINKSMDNLNLEANDDQLSVMQKVLKRENNVKLASILALDLFLVGVDTTSNAVASILYQLSINPKKQQLLHEELDRILPNADSKLTIDKLDEMSYLKACIKETMRMFPVVIGNGRQTSSDCVIGGYNVPKGVQIVFQHFVISNQEEFFSESDKFLPERWLKECQMTKTHHPFACLPFGFGKRMCLGKRFAELEIQTLLATIMQNYRVEYHHPKLDYYIHPMYTPNGPLKLKFVNKH